MGDLVKGALGALVCHVVLFSLPLAASFDGGQGQATAPGRSLSVRLNQEVGGPLAVPDIPDSDRQEAQPRSAPPRQGRPVAAQAAAGPVKSDPKAAGEPVAVARAGEMAGSTGQAAPDSVAAHQDLATATEGESDGQQGQPPGPGPGAEPVSDAGTEPVQVIHRHTPPYPALARRRGWQGTVVLELMVAADGSLARLTVHRGSGYQLLDRAALDAVRQWRFSPVAAGGEAGSRRLVLPISFRLKN